MKDISLREPTMVILPTSGCQWEINWQHLIQDFVDVRQVFEVNKTAYFELYKPDNSAYVDNHVGMHSTFRLISSPQLTLRRGQKLTYA